LRFEQSGKRRQHQLVDHQNRETFMAAEYSRELSVKVFAGRLISSGGATAVAGHWLCQAVTLVDAGT